MLNKRIQEIQNIIYKNFNLDVINSQLPIYIFGAKKMGCNVFECLKNANRKISGFIDNDKSLSTTKLFDKPILHPSQLTDKTDEIIIIIASINYVYEIFNQLKGLGFKYVIPAYLLNFINEISFIDNPAIQGLSEDYIKFSKEYDKLSNVLSDRLSQDTLDALIEFRKTFNINSFQDVKQPLQFQYFENFVPYKPDYPFVDCGGYDGDTVQSFIKFCNNEYSKIYFIEADLETFNKGKINTSKIPNIDYFNCAITDKKKQLKFMTGYDTGSKVSKNGTQIIQGLDLDSIVKEDRCFIKMDIEGAEKEALTGAKRLIKNGSILAISAYHKAEDIHVLPQTIQTINPNYKFYLRHYTDTVFETVLYAIPR